MQPLPVIPTPPGQKWREFRIRFLPLIVFACTITGIYFIWSKALLPPTMMAQVEAVSTLVRSPQTGIITNLFIAPFQEVHAGDPIAAVSTTENRQIDSRLQMLRSQISLLQLELGTLVDQDRLAFAYHDYRLEYMRLNRDMDRAKAELPHAEFDLNLSKNLLSDKIVSEFEYHTFASRVDILHADIGHLTDMTADLKSRLENTEKLGEFSTTKTNVLSLKETLDQLATAQRELEDLQSTPVLLRAPIDGVVTEIMFRAGETVTEGDIIATISARDSERVIGYLRQPFAITPESGMPVEIRTRSWERAAAQSTVAAVGAQYVVITNLAFVHPNLPPEVGLPLAITLPAELKKIVRPGELVDVTLLRK
jgi:multidrug resistance efflux pump